MSIKFKINPNFDFNKLIPKYRKSIDNIDKQVFICNFQ